MKAELMWDQTQAIALCVQIEAICPAFGCHVALTGGTLYKEGIRKDCDILFYRIRQIKKVNQEGLWEALKTIGFFKLSGKGWCFKAQFQNKQIDCFFPEEQWEAGETVYPTEEEPFSKI